MCYGGFPMFTRRDPSQGIENFAFDILLGKPCVVATHHDFCRNRYKHLLDFVTRLKALNCQLSWRSLGEVVKRSCRQRQLSPGALEVEMYGAELRLENRSDQRQRYLVRRRECEPSAIKEIRDESGPITWNSVNDHIDFETELGFGQSKTVGIRFHELAGNGYNAENVSYRFRTMLRRYLSEVRDNYIVKSNLDLSALFGWFGDEQGSSMQAAITANPMWDNMSGAVANFTQWLNSFGETSRDHRTLFPGPVARFAKPLYYRNRIIGTP
jgi:hypothetical protein